MIDYIKYGVIAVVLAVAIGFGYKTVSTYNAALADAAKTAQDLKTEKENKAAVDTALASQKDELAKQQTRMNDLDKRLKEKSDESEKAKNDAAAFKSSFDALKKQKPAVRVWADAPIPDDVRQLLREGAASAAPDHRGPHEGGGRPGVDDVADYSHRAGIH